MRDAAPYHRPTPDEGAIPIRPARLHAPGTAGGPCRTACDHSDCRATRTIAASPCRLCTWPCGFLRELRREERGYVHESCAVETEMIGASAARKRRAGITRGDKRARARASREAMDEASVTQEIKEIG